MARVRAASELWPAVPAVQAAASLRSTVWRARRLGPLLRPGVTTLRLGPDVDVDTNRLAAARQGAGELHDVSSWAGTFHLELLPDWPDEWVTLERERLRHLELQVLDDQVAALASRGRVTDALDTALRAIRLEPLRESSHQALIRIFLESGNRSAALSHDQAFVSLLRSELGLAPDPRTTALVQSLLSTRAPTSRHWRTGPGARDRRPGRPPRGR